MGEIFKRLYTVRKASQREITLPPEAPLNPGVRVISFYDGFVLLVLEGTMVDEELLK